MYHRLDGFDRLDRRRRHPADGGLDRSRGRRLGGPVSASAVSASAVSASAVSASAPSALTTLAALRLAAAFAWLARGDFDCDSGGLRLFGGHGGFFGLFLLRQLRSEEHTSNSSHLGISYAVFC